MCWRTRGEEGGHSWTELFTSNSLTPECCVSHMRGLWVSNQLCDREKTLILLSSSSLCAQSLAAVLDKYLSSPLYFFPPAPTFPFVLSLTHPLSLCLSHPLFFSFHYIFISLSWESAPPRWWKGAGSRHPRGKHFNSESKLSRG